MTTQTSDHERAGDFFLECIRLILEANAAAKQRNFSAVESCERRAKSLPQSARLIAGTWSQRLAKLTLADVSAGVTHVRGSDWFVKARFDLAKEEFAACSGHLSSFRQLVDETLPLLPPTLPDVDQIAPLLHKSADAKLALTTLVEGLQRQCGVEKQLLIQPGLRQYLRSTLDFIQDLQRTADGLLGAAGDDPDIQSVSVVLQENVQQLRVRVDDLKPLVTLIPNYQPPTGDKVFIIHGHDEAKWRELRDLLEGRFGLKGRVIVLKEEVNRGQTVISKFGRHADECCYAFALLTPDDMVTNAAQAAGAYEQARPNVLFELGWFYGRLGPQRLCLLRRGNSTLPSDLGGVIPLDFVKDVKEVFTEIEDELRAAGVIGKA